MNKTDLVAAVSAKCDVSKKDSEKIINACLNEIIESLKTGDKVQLIGFGTFEIRERAARIGRNPVTREEIQIKASKVPAFKPGKAFKDTINS